MSTDNAWEQDREWRERAWIGVDMDGTLARNIGWTGPYQFGPPIAAMVERIKRWLAAGIKVRILTARMAPPWIDAREDHMREAIAAYTQQHIGVALEATAQKDIYMIELWDDRAVRVIANTGHRCCEEENGELYP